MTSVYGQIYEEIYSSTELIEFVETIFNDERQRHPVVYDIGCGYGRLIGELLKRTPNVFGIDTDEACREACSRRYPNVDFREAIPESWPAPNLVFFNFHVLNYLSPPEFKSYLNKFAANGMKCGHIYTDFIDRRKLMIGSFQRKKNVNQQYIFENSLSFDGGSGAVFSEKIYENSELVYTKTSNLHLWTLEEVIKTFYSSDLNVRSNQMLSTKNAITTAIRVEV